MMSRNAHTTRLTASSLALLLGVLILAQGTSGQPADQDVLAGPRLERGRATEGRGGFMGRRHRDRDGRRPHRGQLRQYLHMVEQMELTSEQKGQIEQIREQMQQWREQNGEKVRSLHKQMKESRGSGDRDKVHELAQQLKEVNKTGPKPKRMVEQIKAVLNDKQNAQLEKQVKQMRDRFKSDVRRHDGSRFKRLVDQLDLSKEQRDQIGQIRAKTKEQINAVLTDEQKAKLNNIRQKSERFKGERGKQTRQRRGLDRSPKRRNRDNRDTLDL